MVNNPHPDFNIQALKWQACRAVIAGEDAVKRSGELYLPKLDGQTDPEYAAYKLRALFFNATSRTVDSFVGMAFRKPPAEKVPDALKLFISDANLQGQSWIDYEAYVLREILSVGRGGTLVEWSEENRPYACFYQAEKITNWKTTRIKGRTVLSLVVLEEEIDKEAAEKLRADYKEEEADDKKPKPASTKQEQPAEDEFSHEKVKQFRVLKLAGDGEPVYTVEIWQPKHGKTDDFVNVSTIQPKRRGKLLYEIPFVFHGPNNLLPDVDKPPMEDIVSINLSHYRSSADLEHGRHFTGLPTAFAAGFDSNKEYKIGSAVAWVSNDPQANAAYLEFTGQGLQALDKALEQKERQMAVLGARMLEQEKRGVETEAVLNMKQTGEQASLAQIVKTAGESFALILRWALWWSGSADSDFATTAGQVEVKMNTDFNPSEMSPQLIAAIVQANQAGLLSKDSVLTNFKRGELIGGNRTVEEEIDKIESEPPAMQGNPKEV